MNTIILTKNYKNYTSGFYHHDIIEAFIEKSNCFLYGEGYPNYNKSDTIRDVIAKSPFSKENINLIVVNTSWEIQSWDIEETDPHPNINLSELNIPKVFFLNKEYKKLDKKLEYAKKNKFDLVCTVHHDWSKWADQTESNFLYLPFASNQKRFMDYGISKKRDFGFTGALHKQYTDVRYRIKYILFKNPNAKVSLIQKEEFGKYKIYWVEWGAQNFLGKSLVPTGTKYVKFLNSFKTFLSTPSAIGLVGTRYFECMATKTLILCPESDYYSNMFTDEYNCIMFKEDLSNFTEKLHYILEHNVHREKITENAYKDFINNHTYEKRIEKVLEVLRIQND